MKKMFGVLGLMVGLSLGMSVVAGAADDFQKYGVRVRAIYVKPSESFDSKLSGLSPKVSDDVIPELDLEYFFLKNISAELIAGVTRHDIKLNGQFNGSTNLLPPTITVKYHPLAGNSISPYLGVGCSAVFPFNSKLNAASDFKLDNTIGWAVQAGTDIRIDKNLYFNIDYKFLNADTKATINGTKYKLDLNPSLFGVGVGYRF